MSRQMIIHTLESLFARCDECGNCWLWKGANDGHGKPSTKHGGKTVNPRRVARELKDGTPLKPGQQVVPTCHNRLCISPECSIRTTAKGRARIANERGAFNNPAKNRRAAMTKRAKSHISEEMVATVRAARTAAEAASQTGVSLSHSKAIRRGDARKEYRGNPFSGLGAMHA